MLNSKFWTICSTQYLWATTLKILSTYNFVCITVNKLVFSFIKKTTIFPGLTVVILCLCHKLTEGRVHIHEALRCSRTLCTNLLGHVLSHGPEKPQWPVWDWNSQRLRHPLPSTTHSENSLSSRAPKNQARKSKNEEKCVTFSPPAKNRSVDCHLLNPVPLPWGSPVVQLESEK